MRRSAAVKLTLVPMLAASALAYAQPPGQTASAPAGTWVEAAPMPNEVAIPLMSPSMTPTITQLDCEEDPNWHLRTDCTDAELMRAPGGAFVVVRGGYGHYFWTGGG